MKTLQKTFVVDGTCIMPFCQHVKYKNIFDTEYFVQITSLCGTVGSP